VFRFFPLFCPVLAQNGAGRAADPGNFGGHWQVHELTRIYPAATTVYPQLAHNLPTQKLLALTPQAHYLVAVIYSMSICCSS
jgi:hypothetical protein